MSAPPLRPGAAPESSNGAGAGDDARAAHRRRRQAGIALDCRTGPQVRHVGIVFVHGIGAQEAGETLLDWGGAIIRTLLDVRVGHRASADPVIDCQLDPGPGESRYIELQLPEVIIDGTRVPEQHWVMTEAWWAQRVRPPRFGQMAEWLGPRGAIRRILVALLPTPRGVHDPRLRREAAHYPLRRREDGQVEEAAAPGPPDGMRSPPTGRLRTAMRVTGQLYLQAISSLILVLYGILRSIEKLLPIGPLRDGALTRPIDRFMLEWFGDVYVLLGDPAQAASVRSRLVDAVHDLESAGCEEITVVAHSGGAIVSYMTLADDPDLKVDRLITLGEGLNLAWLLSAQEGDSETDARVRYQRLYTNVLDAHPNLRWHDFWASQDPAPVGVLKVPPAGDKAADDAMLSRIESHAVWNRLSFGEDHGTYWDNDEEFVIPMLRLLENRPAGTAVFGSEADDATRSNHRRRRLSILSLWRQSTMLAPLSAILAAYAVGSGFIDRAGDAIATAWGAIPGAQLLTDPIRDIRSLNLHEQPIAAPLAEAGILAIAAIMLVATLYSLIPPPERPIPWANVPGRGWVGAVMHMAPPVATAAILAITVLAVARFFSGSTAAARDAAEIVTRVLILLAAVFIGGSVVLGRPIGTGDKWRWQRLGETWDLVRTIGVMILAGVAVIAPFVAMLVFEATGRTVLGILAIVGAFTILGRIGGWRWSVWDARERMVARSPGRVYPGAWRVLSQSAFLIAAGVALFAAVVGDSDGWLLLALGLVVVTVLLGVSVDVMDAARRDQATPADTMRQHGMAVRGS